MFSVTRNTSYTAGHNHFSLCVYKTIKFELNLIYHDYFRSNSIFYGPNLSLFSKKYILFSTTKKKLKLRNLCRNNARANNKLLRSFNKFTKYKNDVCECFTSHSECEKMWNNCFSNGILCRTHTPYGCISFSVAGMVKNNVVRIRTNGKKLNAHSTKTKPNWTEWN